MSLVSANTSKGEKSKKFQSLNINNIYQGASSKPQQKAAPQKHGLQSLGKVPTARRAPANLPSLKAENFGNDPTINLVPSSGAGWGAQQPDGQQQSQQQQTQQQGRKDVDNSSKQQQPQQQQRVQAENLNNTSVPPPDHSGNKSWVSERTSKQNFLSQRSPLFGQEFPSLESAAAGEEKKVAQQQQQQQHIYQQPPPSQPQDSGPGKSGDKYGPGPSLRPQSFGHWSFGGKPQQQQQQSANNLSNNNHILSNNNDAPNNDNTRSLPPPPLGLSTHQPPPPLPRSIGSVANTLKFDVSANSPLQYFGGPVVSRKQPPQTTPNNPDVQSRNKSAASKPASGGPRRDGVLFQASIIDRDKLRRMDDIDSNDDDWTRSDETFDYNKKIDSDDDEEEEDLSDQRRIRSSWTDQLNPQQQQQQSINSGSTKESNRFDYPPPATPQNNNSQQQQQPVNPSSGGRKLNSEIPFFDEEDQRRAKKNEEVLQNIERARRRREEEEQKYKSIEYSPPPRHSSERHSSGDHYNNGNTKRQVDLAGQQQPQRRTYRQQSCSSNSSREENTSGKHGGYNKFEVTPPPQQQQDYDERKQQNDQRGADQGGYGPRKQVLQPSGVPPRFKRHGGELQQFKRGYQGKGPHHEDDYRSQQQHRSSGHHWDRHSSESERGGEVSEQRVRNDSSTATMENERLPAQSAVAGEESSQAATQQSAQSSKFVALSTSNSKDNFETGSSYSSSSMERYSTATGNNGSAPVSAPVATSGTAVERQHSYEDRRSAESDLGKGGSQAEKVGSLEQSHNLRRSGQQDHPGRKREVDNQQQQQQQHHYNSRHKDEYDFNNIKRNGREKGGKMMEDQRDYERDYRDSQRGSSRGGRGSNNGGLGQHVAQRGGGSGPRGDSYGNGRPAATTQAPKKIILPSRGGRASGRSDKRPSDDEEVEEMTDNSANKHQHHQQQQHSDNYNSYVNNETVEPKQPEIVSKPTPEMVAKPIAVEKQIEQQIAAPVSVQSVDHDFSSALEPQIDLDSTGWFAPRGQPSRRGRGGLSGSAVSRPFVTGKSDGDNNYQHVVNEDDQQQRFNEDCDSSSDRSYDENGPNRRQRNDDGSNRRGGRGGGVVGGDRRKEQQLGDEYSDYNRHHNNAARRQGGPGQQQQPVGKVDMKDPKREQRGPPGHQQSLPISQQQQQQQVKQIAYERRQNKLPPRLAKQKEQNRMKYTGRDGWAMDGNQTTDYQWEALGADQRMDFGGERSAFRGNEAPGSITTPSVDGLHLQDHNALNESHVAAPVQTIIFENTNFKGADKMFKAIDGTLKDAALQMPLGFGGQGVKTEDSASDLKLLDFTFEPTDMPPHVVDDKSMNSRHQGSNSVPASADDLNLKIASVKKVWETESSMSPGPDGGVAVPQTGFSSQGFVTDEKSFGVPNAEVNLVEDQSAGGHHSVSPYDKADLSGANVAKVRPQLQQQQPQQQQQQQQHLINQHLHHQQHQLDVGRNVTYNRLMSSGGLPTLHSPPSILSQPPSLYQAFQMDPSRGVTNQMYPYHGLAAAQLMQSSAAGLSGSTDIFGPPPPTNNQFRMQTTNAGQYGGHNPNQQQSSANQVLLSQSLMSSAMKQPTNQIGPIGSKAGNAAAYQQGGLGALAGSGTSPLLIQYDGSGNPINYLPNAMQRSAGQTAFYQTLASNQAAVNSRQQQSAFNMQGYNQQTLQQQQILSAQLRNQGIYMKPEAAAAAMKNVAAQRNDSLAAAAMGTQLGALQAHHQQQMNNQAAAAANKVATSMANMNIRSHVGGHGGPVGMPQQSTTPGYSPTPIQRPQGKFPHEMEDCQGGVNEKKKNVDE